MDSIFEKYSAYLKNIKVVKMDIGNSFKKHFRIVNILEGYELKGKQNLTISPVGKFLTSENFLEAFSCFFREEISASTEDI